MALASSLVYNPANRVFSLRTALSRMYDFYHTNGFLVVEDMFSSDECDDIVAIFEKYAKPDYRGVMNIDRGYIEYQEYTSEGQKIERIEVNPADSFAAWQVMRRASIVTILEMLQRTEVVALQSMFLFKRAQTRYANQAWNPHQDNAYPLADYGMYLTDNIALTDQDPENGGMYIYPTSHQELVLPNEKVRSFHEGLDENPGHRVQVPEKYLDLKMDLYMKKGSVLFLHGNVIHGSYANNSMNRDRPMFSIPYGTKGITQGKNFLAGRVGQRKEMSLR